MVIETFFSSRMSDQTAKDKLLSTILDLIEVSWGRFPEEFVSKHVLDSYIMSLAKDNDRVVGFCAVSKKILNGKEVYYVEFTVVHPDYQNAGLGTKITYCALRRLILKRLLIRPFSSVEIMLITPNIRVLSRLAKIAKFVYPDPYKYNPQSQNIPLADEETWQMAKELIALSNDPSRSIDREALVLSGSYRHTPWLLYSDTNIPWHKDVQINAFASKYLGYGNRSDKEFIVRAQLDWSSLIKYFHSFHKFNDTIRYSRINNTPSVQ